MLWVILSVLAFFSGVLLQPVWGEFFSSFLMSGLVCFPVFALVYRGQWGVLCLVLGFILGVFRMELYMSQFTEFLPLGWVDLEGKVVEEVDRRLDHQKLTLSTDLGRVLVSISLYETVYFGDHVRVQGDLQLPSEDIDGFSYARYLRRYRIGAVLYEPKIEVIKEANWSVRGALYALKFWVEQRLNRLFLEPEASFSAGLLLGSRKGMPLTVQEAFQKVGLTHIVAISGYNITLIIAGTFLFFSFLAFRARVLASIASIVLFVVLVGASAAVVRAGIMGVVTLWALYTGHKSQVFFALLWSALLMVLWNPMILAVDVGFQLSFASTFGLLTFAPILEELFPKTPRLALFREALILTLAAQITTFPFMAYHFSSVSLVSPVANVLVAPFLPLGMLFSALAVVLGPALALLAMLHLRIVVLLAQVMATWPYVTVSFSFGLPWFSLYLALMVLFLLTFYKSKWVPAFFRAPEEAF